MPDDRKLPEEYLAPKDVQRILNIGRNQAYALISRSDFPKIRIGRTIRIPRSELDKYMKKRLTY